MYGARDNERKGKHMAPEMAVCKTAKKIVAMGTAAMALHGAFGGEPLIYPAAEILAYAKTLEPRLTEIRRDLHRHPELAFE